MTSMPAAIRVAPYVTWERSGSLVMRWDCFTHRLTLFERFLLWIGWETVESTAQRVWPARQYWLAAADAERTA